MRRLGDNLLWWLAGVVAFAIDLLDRPPFTWLSFAWVSRLPARTIVATFQRIDSPMWQGALTVKSQVIWTCAHDHPSREEALECGRGELSRRKQLPK